MSLEQVEILKEMRILGLQIITFRNTKMGSLEFYSRRTNQSFVNTITNQLFLLKLPITYQQQGYFEIYIIQLYSINSQYKKIRKIKEISNDNNRFQFLEKSNSFLSVDSENVIIWNLDHNQIYVKHKILNGNILNEVKTSKDGEWIVTLNQQGQMNFYNGLKDWDCQQIIYTNQQCFYWQLSFNNLQQKLIYHLFNNSKLIILQFINNLWVKVQEIKIDCKSLFQLQFISNDEFLYGNSSNNSINTFQFDQISKQFWNTHQILLHNQILQVNNQGLFYFEQLKQKNWHSQKQVEPDENPQTNASNQIFFSFDKKELQILVEHSWIRIFKLSSIDIV